MGRPKKPARPLVYYVGWIDKRTDPWPNWEAVAPGRPGPLLDGQPLEFLPPDHPDWPGMPFVRRADPPEVVDAGGRMGRYTWPGVRLADGSGRVYLGPTVSALLHPGSRARLDDLDAAFLLFQPDDPRSPQEKLDEVVRRVAAGRRIAADGKVRFVPVAGLTDPTDYEKIIEAVGAWLRRDPFRLQSAAVKKGQGVRVVVNLSTGTTAMSTAWVLLWQGGLLGSPARVEFDFVQGDGGLDPRGPGDDPLRAVPVARLASPDAAPARATADPDPPDPGAEPIDPSDLPSDPAYEHLRQRIDLAVMLGMAVLLEGERGTGKTHLALYAHERRMHYLNLARECRGGAGPPEPTRARPPDRTRFPRDEQGAEPRGRFLHLPLSRYAEGRAEELRYEMFGWRKGAFNGADRDFDGLIGQAHRGTLFLDEIHHLPREVQPQLLDTFNLEGHEGRRYIPNGTDQPVFSDFYLVLATNVPDWRDRFEPDLADRLEQVVLRVPSLAEIRSHHPRFVWQIWDRTFRQYCRRRDIAYDDRQAEWDGCRQALEEFLHTHPLPGNWRDLQRLAQQLLFELLHAVPPGQRDRVVWSRTVLDRLLRTFPQTRRTG
jgi:hypothetical protein